MKQAILCLSPRLYLTADPITCDCTDWEFSELPSKARRYSTNQALHIQRYYATQYKTGALSLHYPEAKREGGAA